MFGGADRAKKIEFEFPVPLRLSATRQHFGTRVLDVDQAHDLALFEWFAGPVPYVAAVAPLSGSRRGSACPVAMTS